MNNDDVNIEEVMGVSDLVAELTLRMSECPDDAIAVLAMTLGRICARNDVEIKSTFDMIKSGHELQTELDNEECTCGHCDADKEDAKKKSN